MRAFYYTDADGTGHFVCLTGGYTEEALSDAAKAIVPSGRPFWLLSDDEITELNAVPAEAVIFNEAQADGTGENI